jgi:hypothetical protein
MTRFRVGFLALGFALCVATATTAPVPLPKKDGKANPAEVHAIGVYEGTPERRPRGGGRQRVSPGIVTVSVKASARQPVILVLSAYEAVVWKIQAPPGAVARVIVSGYEAPRVEGLPASVPVHTTSYAAKDASYFYAYRTGAIEDRDDAEEAKEELRKRDQRVRQLTDRDVLFSAGTYRGRQFVVRPGQTPVEVPPAREP